jgi:hypothetical protein
MMPKRSGRTVKSLPTPKAVTMTDFRPAFATITDEKIFLFNSRGQALESFKAPRHECHCVLDSRTICVAFNNTLHLIDIFHHSTQQMKLPTSSVIRLIPIDAKTVLYHDDHDQIVYIIDIERKTIQKVETNNTIDKIVLLEHNLFAILSESRDIHVWDMNLHEKIFSFPIMQVYYHGQSKEAVAIGSNIIWSLSSNSKINNSYFAIQNALTGETLVHETLPYVEVNMQINNKYCMVGSRSYNSSEPVFTYNVQTGELLEQFHCPNFGLLDNTALACWEGNKLSLISLTSSRIEELSCTIPVDHKKEKAHILATQKLRPNVYLVVANIYRNNFIHRKDRFIFNKITRTFTLVAEHKATTFIGVVPQAEESDPFVKRYIRFSDAIIHLYQHTS